MKTNQLIRVAVALLLSTFNSQLSTAHAQGSLTPPGAPAPTMKSLAQIEPRTPITNTTSLVTISQPGSYYLTHNLTVSTGDGIDINTNNVTLDLNGFTIRSTAASATGNGILLNHGLRNITIANGFIQGGVTNNGSGVYSGSGFGNGIELAGSSPVNVLVSRISILGCQGDGINLDSYDSTVVESCTVRTVGSYGIVASTIKGCTTIDCGSYAIYGIQVSDCIGQSSGSTGIYANTAQNCYGQSNSGYGVYANTAQTCSGYSSSGIGVYAANTALNCYGSSSSGEGLYAAFTVQNCYGSSSSSDGVHVDGAAENCVGFSAAATTYSGIYAETAMNCKGVSTGGGYGLFISQIAVGCYGQSATGTGLSVPIANSCAGSGSPALSVGNKYNMP